MGVVVHLEPRGSEGPAVTAVREQADRLLLDERKVPPPFHAYPADAPVACELLVLEGERLRLRVPGRLIANGVRLGPFTFDLPPRGSVGWHLRPSDAPVPDEDAYRRAFDPVPPTLPPPERP